MKPYLPSNALCIQGHISTTGPCSQDPSSGATRKGQIVIAHNQVNATPVSQPESRKNNGESKEKLFLTSSHKVLFL
jgi:hypothetical protein